MNKQVLLAELETVIEHQRASLDYLELLYDTIDNEQSVTDYESCVLIKLIRRRNGILD